VFKISYRILEDLEKLQSITLDKLSEYDEFYGFIKIKICNNQIRFILDEEKLPYEKAIKEDIFTCHDGLGW